jgi:hypothetical protein
MSAFADFLEGLFSSGEVLLREPPNVEAGESPRAREFLRDFYAVERLQVAGPPLDFDSDVAVAAAGVLWRACWFLLEHGDPPATLERALALPPRYTAAAIFSADLSFRYLPQIQRRALSLSSEDVLPRLLARTLREWPLSGALSGVAEAPLSPLDFAGHTGLMLLYAERLAVRPRPDWTPGGRTRDYLELVYQGKGLELTTAEANKEEHAQP